MNNSFNDLFNTNPKCSSTAAFILGLILIDNLNTPQQNLLGNWIILVGQTILTNASCQNNIETNIHNNTININSKEIKSIYNPIIYDIEKIKKIINELYPNNLDELNALYNATNKIKNNIEKIIKD